MLAKVPNDDSLCPETTRFKSPFEDLAIKEGIIL
jgi:hypothetical protein